MTGLAPKLRFKQNDGSNFPTWEVKKLSHLSNPITRTIDHQGAIPVLTISAGSGFLNQTDRFNRVIAGTSLKKYTLLRKNEFAYNKGASKRYPYGCIYQLKAHSQALIPFVYHSFKLKGECEDFYSFYFEKGSLDKHLRRIISSSARLDGLLNIGAKDFYSILVSAPTLPEQQKIADFLSAIDAKIDAVKRKRDAFERYKKGLMQQIFSQKIRFKQDGGSDFPKWEEKRLGDIYSWVKTNSLSREYLTYEKGEIQNIHYGDIHTKFKTLFHQRKELVPYISAQAPILRLSEEDFCKEGDIIIADASEDYKDIGKSIEIISADINSLLAGLHTFIARPKNNVIALGFSGYLLSTYQVRKQIMRIAQGISVLGISKTNMADLRLNLPTLPEQQKIADFLSAVDAKYDAITSQVQKLEAFKKGLLQQMFV